MTYPENITVSLDMARKMKVAGWPQNETGGVFTWYTNVANEPFVDQDNRYGIYFCPAPTAEEILRRLPVFVRNKQGSEYAIEIIKYNGGEFGVGYEKQTGRKNYMTETPFMKQSLADAAAAMYCHLAERKLLPAAE